MHIFLNISESIYARILRVVSEFCLCVIQLYKHSLYFCAQILYIFRKNPKKGFGNFWFLWIKNSYKIFIRGMYMSNFNKIGHKLWLLDCKHTQRPIKNFWMTPHNVFRGSCYELLWTPGLSLTERVMLIAYFPIGNLLINYGRLA